MLDTKKNSINFAPIKKARAILNAIIKRLFCNYSHVNYSYDSFFTVIKHIEIKLIRTKVELATLQ